MNFLCYWIKISETISSRKLSRLSFFPSTGTHNRSDHRHSEHPEGSETGKVDTRFSHTHTRSSEDEQQHRQRRAPSGVYPVCHRGCGKGRNRPRRNRYLRYCFLPFLPTLRVPQDYRAPRVHFLILILRDGVTSTVGGLLVDWSLEWRFRDNPKLGWDEYGYLVGRL